KQTPLDGISLVGLIDRRMESRPKPMGFWDRPTPGILTPSKEWMASLYAAQQAGNEVDDPARLLLDAGKITQQFPENSFPGHSAWLDWPWKLHRIAKESDLKFELYNLADDPNEGKDLAGGSPERRKSMLAELEAWLRSVVRSLNGKDY
ncbi:MAG: betC 1, partial [Candidatus Aminicenantes bacterium]|nr:betC 1 [Candidatus Aminicenantes bacterium]